MVSTPVSRVKYLITCIETMLGKSTEYFSMKSDRYYHTRSRLGKQIMPNRFHVALPFRSCVLGDMCVLLLEQHERNRRHSKNQHRRRTLGPTMSQQQYTFPGLVILLILLLVCDYHVQPTFAESSALLEKEMYSNLNPTIFAPGGRLFSVEKALEAINADHHTNNLVIAIQCQQGNVVVVVTSEVQSPYILTTNTTTRSTSNSSATAATAADGDVASNPSSSTFPSLLVPDTGVAKPPFARLADHLWGITAGNAADGQLLRLQLHSVAETVQWAAAGDDDDDDDDDGSNDDGDTWAQPGTVAHRLADRRQRATQQPDDDNDDGLLNATALVFHSKDMWRVDPTGQLYQCQAAIVGRRAHVAESLLLKQLSKGIRGDKDEEVEESEEDDKIVKDSTKLQACLAGLSTEDALQLATDCIRNTLTTRTLSSSSSSSSPSAAAIPMRALILQDRTHKWMTP